MSTDPADPRPPHCPDLRHWLETVGEWQLHAGRRLVRLLESQRRLEAHVDALVEHIEQLRTHHRDLQAFTDHDGHDGRLAERHEQLAEAQRLLERVVGEILQPEE